jgi:hypothetical protein
MSDESEAHKLAEVQRILTDITALKAKVAELEAKQTPRRQYAARESWIGDQIAADIDARATLEKEIENARATIQEEARTQMASITSARESISKWVTATKLAATQAKVVFNQAKASEKQVDGQFEEVNERVTKLTQYYREEWEGVKTTVNKTIKDIVHAKKDLTTYITRKTNEAIHVCGIQREALGYMETRISKLEALEKRITPKMITCDNITTEYVV